MTGIAAALLATMLQPLREAMEEELTMERLSVEDAVSMKLRLVEYVNTLEEEIRRRRRERWESR